MTARQAAVYARTLAAYIARDPRIAGLIRRGYSAGRIGELTGTAAHVVAAIKRGGLW
jgi:hypothetical protein